MEERNSKKQQTPYKNVMQGKTLKIPKFNSKNKLLPWVALTCDGGDGNRTKMEGDDGFGVKSQEKVVKVQN